MRTLYRQTGSYRLTGQPSARYTAVVRSAPTTRLCLEYQLRAVNTPWIYPQLRDHAQA